MIFLCLEPLLQYYHRVVEERNASPSENPFEEAIEWLKRCIWFFNSNYPYNNPQGHNKRSPNHHHSNQVCIIALVAGGVAIGKYTWHEAKPRLTEISGEDRVSSIIYIEEKIEHLNSN